ncbi:MAG: hypothetical protein AAGC67_13490 [Myxococcota bacterium]
MGVGEATGRAVCERLADTHRLALVARSPGAIEPLAGMIDEPSMRAACPAAPDEAFLPPHAIAPRIHDLFASEAFPDRDEIKRGA